MLGKITTSLEKFGFEPLETPAVEFAELLKGKYGEDEKLIFEFTDRGDRQVALRYDQTVPLARVVSQYPSLTKPFKRYQIQPSWRAENPQRGRFREFLQADFDIVGSSSTLSDAEIINAAVSVMKDLGFKKFGVKVNDREIFRSFSPAVIRAIDKLKKIGEVGVLEQIKRSGYDEAEAKAIIERISDSPPSKKTSSLFDLLKSFKIDPEVYAFDPTLARGLDYYTELIFELEVEGYSGGSVGGGGRYDDLIGKLGNDSVPAVGFSFGVDRLIEAMDEAGILPVPTPSSTVLVTIFGPAQLEDSLSLVSKLRNQGIKAEVSLNSDEKLDKQLKYADNKKIPYAVVLGPEEVKSEIFTLKDLKTSEQKKLNLNDLIKQLRQ